MVWRDNGEIKKWVFDPENYGIDYRDIKSIQGGDAHENAKALLNILEGQKNAYRDIVALNAAAVLTLVQKTTTIEEGLEKAFSVLENGEALTVLNKYKALSQQAKS